MRPVPEPKPKSNDEIRKYVRVEELGKSHVGQKVWIRGRIHRSRKAGGSLCFLIIRQRWGTVQVLLEETKDSEDRPRVMINWASKLKPESIVDIYADVTESPEKIESCSQHDVELRALKIFAVSQADNLPIRVQDASIYQPLLDEQNALLTDLGNQINTLKQELESATEDSVKEDLTKRIEELTVKKSEAVKYVDLELGTRLDNRVIEMRTETNQAIFAIQSAVCLLFKEYLQTNGFTEIHTPKLISTASEGGTEVFEVKYFKKFAYLAQSPQLYKQMAICGDMERVFEIAPVFRAESSFTHRHMTEFISLDFEMAFNQHYHEVLTVLGNLVNYILKGIETRYGHLLEVVRHQYPFEKVEYGETPLILEYPEAVALLREAGYEMGDHDDLKTATERALGKIVKEKYGVDFFILDKFPKAVRPFYTLEDPEKPGYANAYDLFLRGEEICSGAQRINDPKLLAQRAQEAGINLDTLKAYIESFNFGAPPHAGGAIGLERFVMLYLGIGEIKKASLFPRDPIRLDP